jgi:hypothetical protein
VLKDVLLALPTGVRENARLSTRHGGQTAAPVNEPDLDQARVKTESRACQRSLKVAAVETMTRRTTVILQIPIIRRRLGERVKSTLLLPFKIGPVKEREARESGLWLKAWLGPGAGHYSTAAMSRVMS